MKDQQATSLGLGLAEYRDVETSQLKLEPTLYKQTSMETNTKLANSASEEFENLYKVCTLDITIF